MMDLRQKIADVLTDEQKQQLQEKLQNLRQGGGRFGAGGPAVGQPPTTRPDQAMPPRIQQTLQRLQESIATLELSDDQKRQVQSIIDDGKKQLMEMRDKVQAGAMKIEELRTEAPQVFAAMRDQLAGVLTKDQQEKLRDAIQSRFDRDNAPGPAGSPPATKPAMMKADPFESNPKPEGEQNLREGPAAKPQALAPPDTGPKVGATAPEFSLEGLNGRTVQLSSFKAKPLVIEFGSYSSPSFRQRAAKMDELARQYSTRANFLIIYTKEAHAVGEWEVDRNRDEGVRVAKHTDMGARKSAAKDAKQALRITIPIAMDDMNDSIATAYGAGENSAVAIGRDGTVVARQQWCDPFRLRAALDEALASRPTTAP
jgi:hypothetical protein